MVFQPNVALRILLWIFVFAVGQFPLICVAQTAAENQTQISEINQRLSEIQKDMDSLKAGPGVTETQKTYLQNITAAKTDLENLETRMRETAFNTATNQLGLSNNYFQILVFLVTAAGALGALIGFVIKTIVTEEVLRKANIQIEEQINKTVKERSRYEAQLMLAEACWQPSFISYQHYEPEFLKFMRHQPARDFSSEVILARRFSKRGRDICENLLIENREEDDDVWRITSMLTSLWVYNRTAELLVERRDGTAPTFEEVSEVLLSAEKCLTLSRHKKNAQTGYWYDLQETAAFAMIKLGQEGTQEYGRSLICNLFALVTPGSQFKEPPKSWLIERWNEYFPLKDDGTRDNLLGLRSIPQPT